MFGFYSFSEQPFSAAALDGVTEGQANLQASGIIGANESLILSGIGSLSPVATITAALSVTHEGQANLQASGIIIANGSLVLPVAGSLSSAATITAAPTAIAKGDSLLVGSGIITANESLILSGKGSLSSVATITAVPTTIAKGTSLLIGPGIISANESLILSGAGSLNSVATITAAGRMSKNGIADIIGSGTISAKSRFSPVDLIATGIINADESLILSGAGSLSSVATITAAPTTIAKGTSLLIGSGVISANESLILSGASSLSSVATITASPSVINKGQANLQASGIISENESLILSGAGSLNSAATITAAPTTIAKGTSLLIGPGIISANESLILSGIGSLSSIATITADPTAIAKGTSLLVGSGIISANESLILSGIGSLNSAATITAAPTTIAKSTSLLIGSGIISANESLILSGAGSLSSIATITASPSVIHEGQANLQASGIISKNGSVLLSDAGSLSSVATITAAGGLLKYGSADIIGIGTFGSIYGIPSSVIAGPHSFPYAFVTFIGSGIISANESLILSGAGSLSSVATITAALASPSVTHEGQANLQGSGIISANESLILSGAGSLSSVATITVSSDVTHEGQANLQGSGIISANESLILSGTGSLSSVATITAAGRMSKNGIADIIGSGTITAHGSFTPSTDSGQLKASIGETFAEFIKGTKRLNYVPAMPLLSHKDRDIVLDFPFYEGAGNLHSVSSRVQIGDINMLMWGRVDGRQSLTSNGNAYNNFRISFDTNGLNFNTSTIVMSFKPTRSTAGYQFLFNNRGTASNNNEIDCYSLNSSNKVRIDIYNGTTKQTLDVTGLILNKWNTLVVSWGDNLNASLNGGGFITYSSIAMPSVIGNTFYVLGNPDDRRGMEGSIDHFRFYNREVSDIEAKELHKNINKDYTFNSLIPNHYRMSELSATGRILKNGRADIIGNGAIAANGSSTPLDALIATLSATATFLANGTLSGELDIVPFTVFINRLEKYDQNVYQTFVKEMNVARSKIITASIDQQKTNTINIDKILEKALEK